MTRRPGRHALRRPWLAPLRVAALLLAGALVLLATGVGAPRASATSFVPISGAGSTWSQNALDQWIRNVAQYGMRVDYAGTGSSDGRNQFRNGTVDFAVSEIPYGTTDNGYTETPPSRHFAYMPIVAGGTSFMYNLHIGSQQVTNLRLSGAVIAGIFTGTIKYWNDRAIQADNPNLALPARRIIPVVRSDGSGTTAQLSLWLSKTFPSLWNAYCAKAGRSLPCGQTSNFPIVPGSGFVAQSGSLGVSGYVAQSSSEGAITYVEYSYALNAGFPIAKVLNHAGYYIQPTAQSAAVALLGAKINEDPSSPLYLTQILDGVYNNPDPRTYPLSSYSYMIIPTALEDNFSTDKGRTLGAFAYYFLCQGQQQAPVLGYSPLPINLVQAGFAQVRKIPGVVAQSIDIRSCNNPTFSSDGSNLLAKTAPYPSPCDKYGVSQCVTGTGGAVNRPTIPTRAGGTPTSVTAAAGGSAGSAASPSGAPAGAGVPAGATASASSTAGAVGSGAAAPTAALGGDTGGVAASGPASTAALGVAAVPVSVGLNDGGGLQVLLMALAGLLLVGVSIGPPVLARRLAREGRS